MPHAGCHAVIGYGANVNNQNPAPLTKTREVYTVKKKPMIIKKNSVTH